MLEILGTVQLFSNRKIAFEWFADLTMDTESLVDPAARPRQVFVLTRKPGFKIDLSYSMQAASLPLAGFHTCFPVCND